MPTDPPLDPLPSLDLGRADVHPPSPRRNEERAGDVGKGWYDSSFELKRGLWVIETDLDPAVTHGIVVRKRVPHGGTPR